MASIMETSVDQQLSDPMQKIDKRVSFAESFSVKGNRSLWNEVRQAVYSKETNWASFSSKDSEKIVQQVLSRGAALRSIEDHWHALHTTNNISLEDEKEAQRAGLTETFECLNCSNLEPITSANCDHDVPTRTALHAKPILKHKTTVGEWIQQGMLSDDFHDVADNEGNPVVPVISCHVSKSIAPPAPYIQGSLGIRLAQLANGKIIISKLQENGPTHRDGRVKVGDLLLSVGGIDSDISTDLDAAKRALAGPAGSLANFVVGRHVSKQSISNHRQERVFLVLFVEIERGPRCRADPTA